MARNKQVFSISSLRKGLLALLGALGLLGAASQARAQAAVERDALQSRVDAVRGAAPFAQPGQRQATPPDEQVAQWNNWNNWNNWSKSGNG